jgi:hypothetical protein
LSALNETEFEHDEGTRPQIAVSSTKDKESDRRKEMAESRSKAEVEEVECMERKKIELERKTTGGNIAEGKGVDGSKKYHSL